MLSVTALAEEPLPEITAPPAKLGAPAFYKKYIEASGYPIVASGTVNDYALREAAYITDMMLAKSGCAKPTTRRWRRVSGKANTPR